MKIRFTERSIQETKKLDLSIQKRIKSKLLWFSNQPNPLFFAKKLKDSEIGSYRFRIGDYRVIFDVVKREIIILTVAHRRDVYL